MEHHAHQAHKAFEELAKHGASMDRDTREAKRDQALSDLAYSLSLLHRLVEETKRAAEHQ